MGNVVLGLDVGGANLKAALDDGTARTQPFALWKHSERLCDELAALSANLRFDRVAVTMTGELCDCFATKRDGVRHILSATRQAFGEKPVAVWRTDERFVALDAAMNDPMPVAAANWLALAVFCGRLAPIGRAMLVDIGSTTTDIVLLVNGRPECIGRDDTSRLRSGELIYTGVRRTPLCVFLGFEVMAEFFATTHDVYLILGDLTDDVTNMDTADGRPATKESAHSRLARMIGGDAESVSQESNFATARRVSEMQIKRITAMIRERLPVETLILSGAGEFLADRATTPLQIPRLFFSHALGAATSGAACAHAVAVLAAEERHGP